MAKRMARSAPEGSVADMFGDSTEPSSDVHSRAGALGFAVVSLVCLSAWGAFIPSTLAHNAWIYSWDSAPYIETARSIIAGRGFVHRTTFGLAPNIWEPIRFWPPGYPILIALAQITGLSPMAAALVVPLVSAGIFIILLVTICLRLFHGSWVLAILAVLAAVCTPAFLHISTSALSDMSYLAFASASLACLLSWSSRPNASWRWLTAAGLLAGLSWGIRNTALALLAATVVFLLCHLFWLRLREVVTIGLAWLAGVAIGGGPFVIRNWVAFGEINPYTAPPSDLSLREVLSATRLAIFTDLTKSDNAAAWIGGMADKRLVAVAAVLAALAVWFRIRRTSLAQVRENLRLHKHHILLISYAFIYMAVLIVARSRYWLSDFPGGAAPRHFLQIYWIIWIYFAVFGLAVLRHIRLPREVAKVLVVAGLLLAIRPQIQSQLEYLNGPIEKISIDSTIGSQAAIFLKREVGKDQIVWSSKAYLLRLYLDLNARVSAHLQPFTREGITRAGQSGLLWGIVVEEVVGARNGENGPLIQDIVERPQNYPELARIQIPSPALILKYVGKPTASDG